MPPLLRAATAGNVIALTSPTTPYEGDRLTFHWTTDTPIATNWIGVYDGDRQPGTGGSLVWVYTPAPPATPPSTPPGLSGGPYTAYLLAKDGYGILARTAPFSFVPGPSSRARTRPWTPSPRPRTARRGVLRPPGRTVDQAGRATPPAPRPSAASAATPGCRSPRTAP